MYGLWFTVSVLVCGYLVYIVHVKNVYSHDRKTGSDSGNSVPEFKAFQKDFLIVYFLCVAADWIQGPYLYKLYSYYGFNKGEIGFLFVTGYCSSAVLGTLVASMADQLGRKRTCLLFCACYIGSCLLKHFSDYNLLILGRVLGGISTSILFSVFETWYMHEHQRRHAYPDSWLVNTLSLMTLGSSAAAVATAVLASMLVDSRHTVSLFHLFSSDAGGRGKPSFLAAFDCAVLFLLIAAFLIWRRWKENDGGSSAGIAVGWVTLASNPRVWVLGLIQAGFEGAMYVFVFSWTPILEATLGGSDLGSGSSSGMHHGIVFATFMVSIMIGSNLFTILVAEYTKTQASLPVANRKNPTQQILLFTFITAMISLLIPGIFGSHSLNLMSFCVFEVCVGIYFPGMAYQRLKHVPNEVRATIMNLYRVPLNVLVVLALLNVGYMSVSSVSLYCAALLAIAAGAQFFLNHLTSTSSDSRKEGRYNDGVDKGLDNDDSKLAPVKP